MSPTCSEHCRVSLPRYCGSFTGNVRSILAIFLPSQIKRTNGAYPGNLLHPRLKLLHTPDPSAYTE